MYYSLSSFYAHSNTTIMLSIDVSPSNIPIVLLGINLPFPIQIE